MTEPAAQLMTVEEFLRWDDGTDTRYELADGVVRAKAPPANAHGTVVSNAGALVHASLRARPPCRVQAEAGMRISDWTWWQADLAVTCTPITPGSEIDQPRLVVEVLSPSTKAHDLGRKLNDYKALPSVEEVWMIDSERRWAQVWHRTEEGWAGRDYVGQASFASAVIGCTVRLDELYESSGL
jgi:Uma2 family endonuclease